MPLIKTEQRMQTNDSAMIDAWCDAMPYAADRMREQFNRVIAFRARAFNTMLLLTTGIVLLCSCGIVVGWFGPAQPTVASGIAVYTCWRYARRWGNRPILVVLKDTYERD